MALERTGGRKLAEAVTNHIFGHEHRRESFSVMHIEGVSYEVGNDHGTAGPGLDRPLVVTRASRFHLLPEVSVDERAFLERTCHSLPLSAYDDAARSWKSCACCYEYGNP
ncbi:hypothetical protein SDC9_210540 [bioreactor metagenome]|uniref:Uncharacterized protein n=1 Tax=bioreactor metagenome TaxID=1076179 RepID=A0A645JHG6_9ZZZZ